GRSGIEAWFLRRGLLPTFRAELDGVQHRLVAETILEVRTWIRPGRDAIEEILHRMNEGMFVADDMAGRPPVRRIGVCRLRHVNRAEALIPFGIFSEEDLELVHALEVECDRPDRPVDLEGVRVSTSGRKPRGVEASHRAIVEPGKEAHRIVDGDLTALGASPCREPGPDLASGLQRTLLDKRLRHPGDLDDVADEVLGQVDAVGSDITERSGPRQFLLQAPHEREFRIHDPVLEVVPTKMPNLADLPRIDDVLREP